MESNNNQTNGISVPRKNWLGRITGVFYEPAETFRQLDEKPDLITALLIPLVVTLISGSAGIILSFRNPEFMDKMSQMPDKANPQIFMWVGAIVGIIFALIWCLGSILLKSGIIHVIAPFMNGKGNYKNLLTVIGYAYVPYLIFSLLFSAYVILNPSSFTPLMANLSILVKKDEVSPLIFSLLSQFDVFVFWMLFLCITGVSVVYKFSRKKAAIIILGLWLVTATISVIVGGIVGPKLFPKAYNQTSESVDSE